MFLSDWACSANGPLMVHASLTLLAATDIQLLTLVTRCTSLQRYCGSNGAHAGSADSAILLLR